MPWPDNTPPMIRTDHTNPFAHDTMQRRVPDIVTHVLKLNADYPAPIRRALESLRDAMPADAPILPLELPAPDWPNWEAEIAARTGHSWLHTDWFYAENYAYRLIIQAVRWWETGRDPFLPIKLEEQFSEDMPALIEAALAVSGSPEARLHAQLHGALWGNRIDLSYAPSTEHGVTVHDDDLLVDDSAAVVEHLLAARSRNWLRPDPGDMHIVADNFGRELAMDLVLADELLSGHHGDAAQAVASRVFLHVKMHPVFVSDATAEDVRRFIASMSKGEIGSDAQDLGIRLQAAREAGRFRLAPDLFWDSATVLWNLPPRLYDLFRAARLVILKGDANYRRMAGDAAWSADIPFAAMTGYFPAPLLAMRALKSDVIVGLQPGEAEYLDGIDAAWRTNGKRGVLQFKP
ncbi:MAG: protein-glutamate O-methyltransferase family protein [Anaerolineae bacterium]|nr:protein-glutamate O-methyltransferase family protein [Anaerolineae bacterium]